MGICFVHVSVLCAILFIYMSLLWLVPYSALFTFVSLRFQVANWTAWKHPLGVSLWTSFYSFCCYCQWWEEHFEHIDTNSMGREIPRPYPLRTYECNFGVLSFSRVMFSVYTRTFLLTGFPFNFPFMKYV